VFAYVGSSKNLEDLNNGIEREEHDAQLAYATPIEALNPSTSPA
jgi:hypothetical protein